MLIHLALMFIVAPFAGYGYQTGQTFEVTGIVSVLYFLLAFIFHVFPVVLRDEYGGFAFFRSCLGSAAFGAFITMGCYSVAYIASFFQLVTR